MKLFGTMVASFAIAVISSQTPTEFDKDFKLASDAYAKHDLKEAKRLFDLCLADAKSRANIGAQAKALSGLAKVAAGSGRLQLALDEDENSLAMCQKLGKRADVLASLSSVAIDYESLAQYDKALEFHARALSTAEQIGEPAHIALSLYNVGGDFASLGQFDKALAAHRRSLAIGEKIGNAAVVAASLNVIGSDYRFLGEFDKGLQSHQRVLAMLGRGGDPGHIADTLSNLGVDYYCLGQLDKSLEYAQKSLAMLEKIGTVADVAQVLNNMAEMYRCLGQLDKALEYAQKALTAREQVGNPNEIAESLDAIGAAYGSLGQFDKASEFQQKALAMQQKIGNLDAIALTLGNLAAAYGSLGQFDKASELQQKALAMREKIGNPADIALTLSNAGVACSWLGQLEKSLRYFQKALAIRKSVGNLSEIASSLDDIGSDYNSLGRFEKSLEYCRKSLAMRDKISNPADIANSLNVVAKDYASLRRYADADQAYAKALKLYEDVGGQVVNPSELGTFQSDQIGDLYARFAAVRVKEGHEQEALAVADRGRARGLSRQIVMEDETIESFLSPEDAKTLEDAHYSFIVASNKLKSLGEQAEQAQGETKVAVERQAGAARAEISETELKYGLVRDTMLSKYPRFRLIAGEPPASVQRVVELSRNFPDTLFLEYALEGDKALVFAISGRSGLTAKEIPLKTDDLREEADAYLAAVRSNPTNEQRLARKLYFQLLIPVQATLNSPSLKRICIVADGPLLDLPFAALTDPSGKRLIQRFAVSNAVSLGSLLWPKSKRSPSKTALIVADPTGEGSARVESATRGGFGALPGAKAEGEQIAQEVPGSTALYGGAATESEVKKEMPSYALLHFACHGYLDSAQAMHSALVMAKDSQGDGFIDAEDLLSIPLSAQLAVLSACETGEGLQSGGEGLMGLTWAFQAAGVPAVVASKWQVDDKSTARMMVSFYRELLKGARKDDALRTAMLEEMRLEESPSPPRSVPVPGPGGNRANPYYWAAFQVIGDCSPLKPLPPARTPRPGSP